MNRLQPRGFLGFAFVLLMSACDQREQTMVVSLTSEQPDVSVFVLLTDGTELRLGTTPIQISPIEEFLLDGKSSFMFRGQGCVPEIAKYVEDRHTIRVLIDCRPWESVAAGLPSNWGRIRDTRLDKPIRIVPPRTLATPVRIARNPGEGWSSQRLISIESRIGETDTLEFLHSRGWSPLDWKDRQIIRLIDEPKLKPLPDRARSSGSGREFGATSRPRG